MNNPTLLEPGVAAEIAVGMEWLVDAMGCSPDALRNPQLLRDLCGRVFADLDLRVVGAGLWHPFPPPGGVTGLYLLTESHLACHTYPEHCTATFNLYCCRTRPRWDWERELCATLGAAQVCVRSVIRGPGSDREEVPR